MVIWIVGLPGSGKTTLSKELQKYFKNTPKAIHIDGDDMRDIWGDDLGYSLVDREKNSKRIQKLSSLFEKQGFVVIVSIMSVFKGHREENRKIYNEYLEVFLDVKLEILKKRRKIYQDAIDKKISNVVGIDIEYDKPQTYDIKFEKNFDLKYMSEKIIDRLE